MRLALTALLAFSAFGQLIGQGAFTSTRKYKADGRSYVIEFAIKDSMLTFVPATYPPGPPHYAATISVFEVIRGKRVAVGKPFSGEFTDGKCYEDDPVELVKRAKGQKEGE